MIKMKKISKAGGITIPSDIRLDLGIEKGSGVDIEVKMGKLIISRHTPLCMFCDGREKLVKYHNKDVCDQCIKSMEALINE